MQDPELGRSENGSSASSNGIRVMPQPSLPVDTPGSDMLAPTEGEAGRLYSTLVRDFVHAWETISSTPGCWRCVRCGTVANTGQPDAPQDVGCTGWPTAASTAHPTHRLYRFSPIGYDLAPAYACVDCHKTSTGQRSFADACDKRPTAARSQAVRRLAKGRHPHPRWGKAVLYAAGVPTGDHLP